MKIQLERIKPGRGEAGDVLLLSYISGFDRHLNRIVF